MRIRLLGIAALVALALGAGGTLWLRHAAPEPSQAASQAMVVLPVAPPVPEPAAPPVADKESDLPSVTVAPLTVHTIEGEAALPVPTVTLHQKDGRVIEHMAALEPAPRPAPAQAAARQQATGGASLGIAGLPVHLFGVRPPDPRDRCGSGAAASCGDGARAAVAARLGTVGNVRCTIPAGQRGDPGFVCRDGAGVDLGGLLVTQGFALADTSSSYDYLGAQDAARASRRGLWAYR